MISAEKLLAVLEAKDLLAPASIASLREQLAQSAAPVSAGLLAKRLVEKGQLTAAQAQRVLAGLEPPQEQHPEPAKPSSPAPAQASDSDELGLAPLPEDEVFPAAMTRPTAHGQPLGKTGHAPAPSAARGLSQQRSAAGGSLPAAAKTVSKPEHKAAVKPQPAAVKPHSKQPDPATPQTTQPAAVDEKAFGLDDLGLAPLAEDDLFALPGSHPAAGNPPAAAKSKGAGASGLHVAAKSKGGQAARGTPGGGQAAHDIPGGLPAAAKSKDAGASGSLPAANKSKGGQAAHATPGGGQAAHVTPGPGVVRSRGQWIGFGVGGGLTVLVAAGVLAWVLTRPTGDEQLQQAEADYRAQQYPQAAEQYDRFLADFPRHRQSAAARAHRGLARLHLATGNPPRWPEALVQARELMADLAPHDELAEERIAFTAFLPGIAAGLAAEAARKPDSPALAAAHEALDMVRRCVPRPKRDWDQLARVEWSLALAARTAAREQALAAVTSDMEKALQAGQGAGFYPLRTALLKSWPEAVAHDRLQALVSRLGQVERSAVKKDTLPRPADTKEPSTPVVASLATAQTTLPGTAPGVAGRTLLVTASGSAYGLDAATGKLLWRRFVGFGPGVEGDPPQSLSDKPDSDAIVVDAARHEILRLEATTGRLRWRQALGEPVTGRPAIAGNRLVASTFSGRVLVLDAESGALLIQVQLPQRLRVAPAVDAGPGLIYQPADECHLYVVSLSGGDCQGVLYLGHEAGTIAVPPVRVGRSLVVGVNHSLDASTLLVFAPSSGAGPALQPVQQVALQGHLDTPLCTDGVRAAVATDRGALYLFELAVTNAGQPLKPLAQSGPGHDEGLLRYALLAADRLWLADTRLSTYPVKDVLGKLSASGAQLEQSIFTGPLSGAGSVLFCVRRQRGLPGTLVAAVDAGQGKTLWETRLAAPLAGEPIADSKGNGWLAVTAAGAVFGIDAAGLSAAGVLTAPIATLEASRLSGPITSVLGLDDGRLLLAGEGARQLGLFDRAAGPKGVQPLAVPDELAGRPVVLGKGVLVPGRSGQIAMLDPRAGTKLLEPFQPPLSVARTLWCAPAVVGKDQFVTADGRKRIYLVGVKAEPRPHLAALAQAELPVPIVSPLAVVGKVAYAIEATGALAAFRLPSLARDKTWPLGIGGTWGPHVLGDRVLAAGSGKLLCVDAEQKLVWQVDLPFGPPVGPPLAAAGACVLACRDGIVARIDPASGKVAAQIDTGRPLASGPVVAGDRLLVAGHDGTLYAIPKP